MAQCIQCKSKGILLKLTKGGLCLSCASQRIDEMENMLSPDLKNAMDARATYESEKQRLDSIKKQIEDKKKELYDAEFACKRYERDIIVLADTLEMESFALYRPRYDFANSDEYKVKLDEIRAKQKQMIKEKKATVCGAAWTIDGSKSKGETFVNELSKLFLRSFNNECEIAVQSVKFNNFDRCVARIEKSFTSINALGKVNKTHLTEAYKDLKNEELVLAYEYQRKKQEEKEALAELRAQQREEAKISKEIEAARKEAEKEKKHYLQALEKLNSRLAQDPDNADLLAKKNDLLNNLEEITEKLEDIDYRQSNQRAGYVYIISNVGSFGENVYKIGMTRRLDPMERVYELGDASVPFRFDVHAMIFSHDAPKLEAALHQAFADKRVNMVNPRREYFRVSLEEIKDVVKKNHDKTVEFIAVPEAQQYRESVKLAK